MCFYENLKQCRLQKNMTQKELAESIGVAPSTYSLYESGNREPDVEKIKLLSKILCISADYLLFGVREDVIHDEELLLFNRLDEFDKAEIRGEIKQMLKADKYKNNTSIADDIIEKLKQDAVNITTNIK